MIRAGSVRRQGLLRRGLPFQFSCLPIHGNPFTLEVYRSLGGADVARGHWQRGSANARGERGPEGPGVPWEGEGVLTRTSFARGQGKTIPLKEETPSYLLRFPPEGGAPGTTLELLVRNTPVADPTSRGSRSSDEGVADERVPTEEASVKMVRDAALARSYLLRHDVVGFVQGMLKATLQEKPHDPCDFMRNYARIPTKVLDEHFYLQGHEPGLPPMPSADVPPRWSTVDQQPVQVTLQKEVPHLPQFLGEQNKAASSSKQTSVSQQSSNASPVRVGVAENMLGHAIHDVLGAAGFDEAAALPRVSVSPVSLNTSNTSAARADVAENVLGDAFHSAFATADFDGDMTRTTESNSLSPNSKKSVDRRAVAGNLVRDAVDGVAGSQAAARTAKSKSLSPASGRSMDRRVVVGNLVRDVVHVVGGSNEALEQPSRPHSSSMTAVSKITSASSDNSARAARDLVQDVCGQAVTARDSLEATEQHEHAHSSSMTAVSKITTASSDNSVRAAHDVAYDVCGNALAASDAVEVVPLQGAEVANHPSVSAVSAATSSLMGVAAERMTGDVIDNVCDGAVSAEALMTLPSRDSPVPDMSSGSCATSPEKEAASRVTGATSDLSDDLIDRMGGHAFADMMMKAVNFSDLEADTLTPPLRPDATALSRVTGATSDASDVIASGLSAHFSAKAMRNVSFSQADSATITGAPSAVEESADVQKAASHSLMPDASVSEPRRLHSFSRSLDTELEDRMLDIVSGDLLRDDRARSRAGSSVEHGARRPASLVSEILSNVPPLDIGAFLEFGGSENTPSAHSGTSSLQTAPAFVDRVLGNSMNHSEPSVIHGTMISASSAERPAATNEHQEAFRPCGSPKPSAHTAASSGSALSLLGRVLCGAVESSAPSVLEGTSVGCSSFDVPDQTARRLSIPSASASEPSGTSSLVGMVMHEGHRFIHEEAPSASSTIGQTVIDTPSSISSRYRFPLFDTSAFSSTKDVMGPAEPLHPQTVEVRVENRTLTESNDQLRSEIHRLRSMLVGRGTPDTPSKQEAFVGGEPLCLSTILSDEVASLWEVLHKKNKALNVKYGKLREENKRLRGKQGELQTTLAQFSSSVHALAADVRAAVQDTPAMVQDTRPFLVA
eukprot:CAMPEP_0194494912 /NCGR_PEP_ID=MMETSP0253-20130528/12670_1 /TAXON_ID=2966 /ORGANISM="Noctiluca scintillans" /LENGTH=1127 /DNA_ID=CAMNT_0039336093 /DNA_START=12 /DNA_END=3395 /DNA_ORIENTATION=+